MAGWRPDWDPGEKRRFRKMTGGGPVGPPPLSLRAHCRHRIHSGGAPGRPPGREKRHADKRERHPGKRDGIVRHDPEEVGSEYPGGGKLHRPGSRRQDSRVCKATDPR